MTCPWKIERAFLPASPAEWSELALRRCHVSLVFGPESHLESMYKSLVNPSWVSLKQWLRCVNTAQASLAKSVESTAPGPDRPLQSTSSLCRVSAHLLTVDWKVSTGPLFLHFNNFRNRIAVDIETWCVRSGEDEIQMTDFSSLKCHWYSVLGGWCKCILHCTVNAHTVLTFQSPNLC